MSEFVVRQAIPDDARQMAEVIAAGREQTYNMDPYSDYYRRMVTDWQGAAGERTMTGYMNANDGWEFIGVRPDAAVVTKAESGDVVGVLSTRNKAEHVDVDYVFVDPAEQGKGLGNLLMQNLTERAGGKRQELDVAAHNDRARGLYEKFGFVAVGYPKPGQVRFQKMIKPAAH